MHFVSCYSVRLQRIKDKAIRKRMEMDCLNRQRGVNELEDEFHGLKTTNDGSIRLVCFKCWNASEGTDKYATPEGKPSSAFRKKTAILLNTSKMVEKYLTHWEKWYLGPNDNVAVFYACSGCKNAPHRTNGWLKAKTCSSGSYAKTQWHCPHCAQKWKWGSSAADRWIIIYSGKDDVHPVHFTWGHDKEDWCEHPMATQGAPIPRAGEGAQRDQSCQRHQVPGRDEQQGRRKARESPEHGHVHHSMQGSGHACKLPIVWFDLSGLPLECAINTLDSQFARASSPVTVDTSPVRSSYSYVSCFFQWSTQIPMSQWNLWTGKWLTRRRNTAANATMSSRGS
eukprot:1369658-Amphidinium_carterae.1